MRRTIFGKQGLRIAEGEMATTRRERRESGRRELSHEAKVAAAAKREAAPPSHPARDEWNVALETLVIGEGMVFALMFQRKGTSVFVLHRHFRSRSEAEAAQEEMTCDLQLPMMEFEAKYILLRLG